MRKIRYFIIFSCMLLCNLTCPAVLNGKVDYSIPIDYSRLSEKELAQEGRHFLELVNKEGLLFDRTTSSMNKNMTRALLVYHTLQHVNPTNANYPVQLGVLYDKIDETKLAKACFSRAISIDSTYPYAYYYFGEHYYKQTQYRKALSYYLLAYDKGLKNDYKTLYKLGDIYEKLGDTRTAIKYFNLASRISKNAELTKRLDSLIEANKQNKLYYSKGKS